MPTTTPGPAEEREPARTPRIRLTLKLKLSLLFAALLVLTVVTLSVALLDEQQKSLSAEMRKRGETIARDLAASARDPLLAKDTLTLNRLVKETMDHRDVRYAIITDHSGKILAHGDVSLIGKMLQRPAGLRPLADKLDVQTYSTPELGQLIDFSFPLAIRQTQVGAVYLGFSQQAIDKALATSRNWMISISVVMLVVGVVGVLRLATVLARPILRLVEGTRVIASGDFKVNLAVPSRDEIGVLTESFNLMAKSLQEKEMIKRAFARYVAREVVDELLKDPEKLVLTGERREVTVLFCDVRGFTALTERLRPEEVVLLLNDFYDLMIDATFKFEGTLDKFLGDAVMAVFGAPIALSDHALRSVRTAVIMRSGIERLSAQRIHAGREPVTVGIGISTGEVVAGTVGTEERMEYTVIGDSVNLAARLESSAKPMQILISGRTYRDVKDHVDGRPLGVVKVKGKEEEVEVYEVLGLK